ncbi:MAG: endonuclease MutS2 [Proteobacteria bacterium]|nr:endonuclease MutS2 [Pseudomonadota bacterium]
MKKGFSKADFLIDDRSLKALEFFEVVNLLEQNTSSPIGKERCRQVRPTVDLSEIKRSLSQINELKRIDSEWGPNPPVDLCDTRDALKKTRVTGAVLEPQELIDISTNIQTCQKVKRFFKKTDILCPHLVALIDRLSVCEDVGAEIRRCLDPDGMIRDEASSNLKRLRETIRELRTKIQKEMESLLKEEDFRLVLQDRIITQRNGRTVLLVKPEFRGRIKGIVHDCSHSRMSLYVEPISVVEMNNDLNVLLDNEREEEIRVLQRLTETVREEEEDLSQDLEVLGELDLVCAKMKLSQLLQGIQPEIDESGSIRLLKARHPFLFQRKPEETVPIDLILEPDHPVLVISGANAGGKTVALKTLGLLALMFQSGMEIPVGEGSQISVHGRVFAEIGDEQSIGDDLSTFSAHLLHLNDIFEVADANSLVLVDEICGGTNVTEGAAMAMGVLDYLRERGAAVVVTTHLDPLKEYGYATPGVKNVGVEFDPETLQPLYRLSYGTSAPSHAFLVAEKMGVSRDVLKKASRYQQKSEGSTAAIIQKLEQVQVEVNRRREDLSELQEQVARRRARLDELLRGIREKRAQILLRVEERGRRLLRQTEKELKELVQSLPPPEAGEKKPERKIQEIDHRFRSQVRRQRRKRAKVENLKPGEWVRILDLNREGMVSNVQEAIDTVEVLVGKFKIKTSLDNLRRVESGKGASQKPLTPMATVSSSSDAMKEINVIGLTVDEALPVVDKFIDGALVESFETVTIIHGIGSGKLREAIQDYLRRHRAVTGLGCADPARGGVGVTVVQLGWDESVALEEKHNGRPHCA